ncbi:MAG: ParB/RepB/Spo0J family partition protein [Oscillospiraceae bacterium]|nr:ParB/RepB/Spo0J family partition protein [Oscillospiraceae bacterium]
MANTSRGLGKGLGALLGDAALRADAAENLHLLPLAQIECNADQPRKRFDETALAELADSIREHGVLQPLTVRRLSSGYYQIVAGERRWRAARLAGLKEVPAVVVEADDRKATELALIENLQREDLDPIEEAEGYRKLMDSYRMTQEDVASRVGKSRSAVANALRLLGLCPEARALLEAGKLSGGHARALLPLNATQQKKAARAVVDGGLSVRQTEALVKKLLAKPKAKKQPEAVDYAALAASELTDKLGRGCRIVAGKRKGRVELEYYGMDDLNDLLDALAQLKKRKRK